MNVMTEQYPNEASRPWFKQPWLWFVLSVPIASVILSSIMVTVAVVGKDSLVSDNYYKDGMGINQTIEQDKLADALSLQPTLTLEENAIVLKLVANEAHPQFKAQPFLTLKVLHPTVGDKDLVLKLLPSGDNVFVAELPQTIEGRRYLDLYAYDESWRIREELSFPFSDITLNRQL